MGWERRGVHAVGRGAGLAPEARAWSPLAARGCTWRCADASGPRGSPAQEHACCHWADGLRHVRGRAPVGEPQGLPGPLEGVHAELQWAPPEATDWSSSLAAQRDEAPQPVPGTLSPAFARRPPEWRWQEGGPVHTCSRRSSLETAPPLGSAGGTPSRHTFMQRVVFLAFEKFYIV